MPRSIAALRALVGLAGRSLADPVSVGVRAWAAALPLVMIDAFSVQFLVLPDPDVPGALTLAGIAALGYAMAGIWLAIAHLVMTRFLRRWLIGAVTWALVGITWGGVLVAWSRTTDGHASAIAAVGPVSVLVATTAMSVVFAGFVAIVLHSHRRAQAASEAAVQAAERYRSASEQMAAVHMSARLSLRNWLDEVFQPAIAGVRVDVESGVEHAAERIDAVREQVVRVASRRLHPRTVSLGLDAALGSVLRAHGLDDRLDVDGDQEISAEVTACLARCLDVILTSHQGGAVRVVVDQVAGGVRMQVSGTADYALASGPEVLARVANLDGTVAMTRGGVQIEVPRTRGSLRSIDGGESVAGLGFDVPVVVAIALTLLTGIVIAALDGSVLAIPSVSLAVVVGSMLLRNFPVSRAVTGDSMLHRTFGLAAIIAAAGVMSAMVTLVWWATSDVLDGFAGLFIFWLANSFVVVVVIAVVVVTAERLKAWQRRVDLTEQMSAAAAWTARSAIGDVDRFREEIARALHSHVQARLIVAAGRLEDPHGRDIDGARRALAMIEEVDVPHLRRIAGGGIGEPRTLHALSGAFVDVDVLMHVDERFDTDSGGSVVEVVHEAIVNAVRHGGASSVRVDVTSQGSDWVVTVADDGLGPSDQVEGGLGLSLVDAASAGRWELTRDAGGGARLTARVGK